jgi:glycosyltransferase involved in cell wall biosynthesis
MRVLMLSLGYPKVPGDSTAPFIEGMVRSLNARGHEIDVILPHHPDFQRADTEGVCFLPYRYSPVPGFAPWGFGNSFEARANIRAGVVALLPAIAASLYRRVRTSVRSGRYDLVHANWVVPNGWIAASVADKAGLPVVITSHGTDIAMAEKNGVLGSLARRAFGAADGVTATSADLRDRAVKLGAADGRAVTIHIGVDTELFAPGPQDNAFRKAAGVPEGDLFVLAVGRLAEVKGFQHLVSATALLENVTTVIAGDGEYREPLSQLVRESGARVKLIGGIAHSEVPRAMNAADIVVVPSVVDRAGRVDATTSTVPAALACGRPVIASAVGGIPELVDPGQTGLLVPPGDAHALADAIERLRSDGPLRASLSSEARRYAVERLGWPRFAEQLEAVYQGALDNRRSPKP